MSRLHPFDYAFGEVADRWFPAIRTEAAGAKQDAMDLRQFIRLESVHQFLGELGGESEKVPDKFAAVLYSASRFWEAGRKTLTVDRAALERGMDDERPASPKLPGTPCYVQLPERWIWCRVHDGPQHEPLDGLFVAPMPERAIMVLGVLGLREDRGGFGEVSAGATGDGFEKAARELTGPRFVSAMEGGATAGFRSVNSNIELLLLASLALASAKE